jgi:hypothetical protein
MRTHLQHINQALDQVMFPPCVARRVRSGLVASGRRWKLAGGSPGRNRTALNDLDAIADYIALDNPAAASELVQRIFRHATS